MISEHSFTDDYLAKFHSFLGQDCGIVAVKQEAPFSGTGPFSLWKPDFFEFPSGMQVSTAAVVYNAQWGLPWYCTALAATEKQMVESKERHIDLRTGYSVTKPLKKLSPCLDHFRPTAGGYL